MNRQRVEEKAGDVIEMMISDVLRLDAGTLHAYARARSLSLSCTQTLQANASEVKATLLQIQAATIHILMPVSLTRKRASKEMREIHHIHEQCMS